MTEIQTIYLDTTIEMLKDSGIIDRTVYRSCQAAKPPMLTAGDIMSHLEAHGSFADVPGCRRPGRIPDTLVEIARKVEPQNTPTDQKPVKRNRTIANNLESDAAFDFLTGEQRDEVLDYRKKIGHLPMFRILRYYLTRPDASRNDTIMALVLGFTKNAGEHTTFAEIGHGLNLSRERVRQIAQNYSLPEQLMHPSLWKQYADHSTYYADHTCRAFHQALSEVESLTFATYAMILQRTTMLNNVDDRYLARRGWTREIKAWVEKLERLSRMPRAIDNRISLEGLAMGGTLDTRISLIVLHQIAPAIGIIAEPPDGIILPKNQ